ncbi:MAG: hypothetical protein IKI22_00775 [Neisseriaceae bacterium]|nr:hypothetical protein [Neisseriaceae bacterium]
MTSNRKNRVLHESHKVVCLVRNKNPDKNIWVVSKNSNCKLFKQVE